MLRHLVTAVLLFSSTAVAQVLPPNFWCRVTAGAPSLIRSEGLAEKVNDIVITCAGGTSGSGGVATFTVALNNAPVTSRITAPASGGSEALLLVDDPAGAPVVGTNVFQGAVYGNQVVFTNVPVDPPVAPAERTFRITNVRVNARDLPENSLVHASVSISGGVVMVSNPVVAVGLKAPGVFFGLQTAAGAPAQTLAIQAGGGGALTHRLVFTEGFARSFRKRNTATTVATPGAISDQKDPGTDYGSESGYYNSGLPAENGLNQAGLATQGSRLVAKFTNLPAGVSLYATTRALPNTGASSAILTASDLNGAGSYSAATETGTVTVAGSTVAIAPVSLTNGSGTAAWELLDADSEGLESYTFGLIVVSGQSGSATVVGGLGPISASIAADSASPVPRFASTAARAAACAVSPCLTAAPGAISLQYQTGTAGPAPITIRVDSTGAAIAFQAAVSATPEGWLSVTPSSGVTPANLQVTINPTGLYPDVYQGNIVLDATGQTVYIPVIVSVTVGPSGYVPMGCSVYSANPTVVRAEGMSEVLGDVVVQCTGGTPTAAGAPVPAVDVKVTLPTPITSRTYSNGWSEVLLIMDEAGAGAPGVAPQVACNAASGSCAITGTGNATGTYSGAAGRPNVFAGRVTGNVVTFPSVPIDPPGTGGFQMYGFTYGRVLRIVNLRADGTGYPPSLPGQAVVSGIVSAGPIAVRTPVQSLGYISPAMSFELRTPDNSATSTGAAVVACAPGAQRAGVLQFRELFAHAFKERTTAVYVDSETAPGPQPQRIPATIYSGQETGFYNPDLVSPVVDFSTVGLANFGTRLRARITGIPTGARVFVSTQRVAFTNGTPSVSANGPAARLISNETAAFSPAPATTTIEGIAAAELAVTNGTADAVWEVLRANPSASEPVDFLFWVERGSANGTASVTGSLAPAPPAFPDAGSHTASSTLPGPRFASTAAARDLFSLGECPLVFTTPQVLPAATDWVSYNVPLQASGGRPPYAFLKTGGTLPTGLRQFPPDSIAGIPQGAAGDYSLTFKVTDADRREATRTFSLHVNAAPDPGPPTADSVSPASGTGHTGSFTFQFSDPAGIDDVSGMSIWFAPSSGGGAANSCRVDVTVVPLLIPHGLLFSLLDDSGAVTGQSAMFGQGSLQNSQCIVDLPFSNGSETPTRSTITLKIHFLPSFAGAKNVYMSIASKRGVSSGWQQRGTWNVGGPIYSRLLTPTLPAGANTQVFTGEFTFPNVATDARSVGIWLTNGANRYDNTCMVEFSWQTGQWYLHGDDINTTTVLTPNTGLQQNSQCIVDTGGLQLTGTTTTVQMRVPLTFKNAFLGPWNVYLMWNSVSGGIERDVQGMFTALGTTSVTLAPTVSPSIYGRPVTLTATVQDSFSGRVTFYDGVTVLGSSPLVGTTATLSTIFLPAGNRTLRAYYSGDSFHLPARSTPVQHVVNAASATGFREAPPVAVGQPAAVLGIGDFNGDGKPDYATFLNYTLTIQLGNGDGTFREGARRVAPQLGWGVVGDFNEDGRSDLIMTTVSGGRAVYLGRADGTLQDGQAWQPWYISRGQGVADFNGDGKADVAGVSDEGLSILYGKGDGTFDSSAAIPVGITDPQSVTVADFNGDGKADVAISSGAHQQFAVLLGSNNGTFQTPIVTSANFPILFLVPADLNGDGKTDLVLGANGVEGALAVMIGTGTGSFQSAVQYGHWSGPSRAVAAGDFNGDGKIDVAVAAEEWPDAWLHVFSGNGDGTLQSRGRYPIEFNCFTIGLADFNGDGRTDVVTTSSIKDTMLVLLGASPALSIASAHAGNFSQGQSGAVYTLTVSNASGAAPTSGVVTVAETLPAGLTLVSMAGTGWTCVVNSATCTRQDVLNGGQSYPPITVRVNVAVNAATAVTNQAAVSGGSSAGAAANDPTVVAPAAQMTTPAPGSTLPGSTVTFNWTAAAGASAYWLDVGAAAGDGGYFGKNVGTAVSQAVSGLPVNGSAVYVRLWTLSGGEWHFIDYSYTAATATKAAMTTPAPGSTLSGASATFSWNAGIGATAYWLDVNGVCGGCGGGIFGQNVGLATSQTVTGIPTDSRTVYVRLWSQLGGVWQYNDYTYTAATPVIVKAVMSSPTPGSTFSGPTVTFTWAAGSGSAYWLDVGSVPGSGNYFGQNVGLATSRTVTGIPTNGSTVHVRLWTLIGANWQYNDYSYTAAGSITKGVLTSPTPGSTLSGSTSVFTWAAGVGAAAYWLDVNASCAGCGGGIFGQNVGLATSQSVSGLPVNGATIYVRLWTLLGGTWQYNDYTYTAAGVTTKGVVVSPTPGATLAGASATFTWNPGVGAAAYWLDVNASCAGCGGGIFGQNVGLATSQAVSGLPVNGATIHVRLWTLLGGNWQYNDYTYTAAGVTAKAVIQTPAPGSTLSGSTVTFTWSSGSGAAAYWLDVGPAPGVGNYYGQNTGLATSRTVAGLPANGSTVYVRLWTLLGGSWQYNDYSYVASH